MNNMTGGQLPMFAEEPACAKYCPNLTFKQRIMGFLASAGIGILLSFMGTMTLIGGPTEKNIRTFIILYIFGNVSERFFILFYFILFYFLSFFFLLFFVILSVFVGNCIVFYRFLTRTKKSM